MIRSTIFWLFVQSYCLVSLLAIQPVSLAKYDLLRKGSKNELIQLMQSYSSTTSDRYRLARIVKVVDGDTFKIIGYGKWEILNRKQKKQSINVKPVNTNPSTTNQFTLAQTLSIVNIRLSHIDAPQLRGVAAEVKQAAQKVKKLVERLIDGKLVLIRIDQSKDKYGRLLGDIIVWTTQKSAMKGGSHYKTNIWEPNQLLSSDSQRNLVSFSSWLLSYGLGHPYEGAGERKQTVSDWKHLRQFQWDKIPTNAISDVPYDIVNQVMQQKATENGSQFTVAAQEQDDLEAWDM